VVLSYHAIDHQAANIQLCVSNSHLFSISIWIIPVFGQRLVNIESTTILAFACGNCFKVEIGIAYRLSIGVNLPEQAAPWLHIAISRTFRLPSGRRFGVQPPSIIRADPGGRGYSGKGLRSGRACSPVRMD
jgi:hypothetical protein